jgi:hypothetical protein
MQRAIGCLLVGCLLVAVAGCGSGATVGRVVTAVEVSPNRGDLLIVTSCEVVENKKAIEPLKLERCKRVGVPRSSASDAVASPGALFGEGRVITGMFSREGGGAVVTTCRLDRKDGGVIAADCREAVISTAPEVRR